MSRAAVTAQTDPAVVAMMRDLAHPRKPAIAAVRTLILGASPAIREGVKWNAPSFRTTEWFATFHLREQAQVKLILHLGAKVKASAVTGVKVADPAGLVEWLGKDRGMVTFADARDVAARGPALAALVRAWIALL